MKSATVKLQKLMKNRHSTEKTDDSKRPQSIKDWINTDVKKWDQLISEEEKNKAIMNRGESNNQYKRKQQRLEKF
jgi:hypothetical protein